MSGMTPTRPTLPTLMNMKLTPHSCGEQLYCHLAALVLVVLQRTYPNQHFHIVIAD